MLEFILAIFVFIVLLYIFINLNEKWQSIVGMLFWTSVWAYPVLYIIHYSDPKSFWPFIIVLLITFVIVAFSFFWQGGFRVHGSGDDDPSGNSNVGRKFTDIM